MSAEMNPKARSHRTNFDGFEEHSGSPELAGVGTLSDVLGEARATELIEDIVETRRGLARVALRTKPPRIADPVGVWLDPVVVGWLPDAGIDEKRWVEQPVSPDEDVRTFPASVIEVLPADAH